MNDFLKIASPLTNLIKKTTKFEWSDRCEETFHELKRQLTVASLFTLSIEDKENTIYSDTSKNG